MSSSAQSTIVNIQAAIRYNFGIVENTALEVETDEISAEHALSIVEPIVASTKRLSTVLKMTKIENTADARLAETAKEDAKAIYEVFNQIKLMM